jgi:ADP-ribose pyrophosphatase YjhB (NUDIX family)
MKSFLSAGLVVIYNHKILLVHPTNASWWGTYSIPKGRVEIGESPWGAALRECYEETGVQLTKSETMGCNGQVNYPGGRRSVLYFLAYLKKLPEIKLRSPDEVNWAGFITAEQAEKRILPVFKQLLVYLK